MNLQKEFMKGIYAENPIFRLALGICPTLAVTSSATNGLGMGLAATFVLVCSNVIIALLMWVFRISLDEDAFKKLQKIRIPIFIVIIATFVTITEMVMNAYLPSLADSLGMFIPLIVVNCIILGRAEAFASKNSVIPAFVDGLGMGLGFAWALTFIGIIRELLGTGKVFDITIIGGSFEPILIMILAPGAFISLGLILGFFNYLDLRKAGKGQSV